MSREVTSLGAILGVWAHPDDEAFLTGGLMAAAVEAGQRVVVVTATRGEAGTPDPVTWPPERLGRLRERELRASLAALGVTEHRWLGHVDGTCDRVPFDVGTAQVAEAIEEADPDTVVTFGPEGMTGHPDHRTVSAWVTAALGRTGSGARLLHATTSHDFLDRHADLHRELDVFFAGEPPWTPPGDLAFELALTDDLLDAKLAALRAQASQVGPLLERLGVEGLRRWWATEWFADGRAAAATVAA